MLAALSRQSHGKGRKAPLHVLLPLPIIIQGVQAPSRVACRACSSSVASSPAADASSPAIFPGSGLATYTGSHALGSGWSKLPTGLQIKDLSTGRGARPKPGEQVTVHYTALDNNTDKLYECTFQSGKPAVFNLNEGGTFPGLNDAVADMQPGGRRLAIVPPQLGYGRFSEPPNMTLVVEIELVRVGAKRGFFASLLGR